MRKTALALSQFFALFLTLGAQAGDLAQAPYYRVFRGVMRPDISAEHFAQQMNTVFIPALPATHAKNGAVAYIPALPPAGHSSPIVDEYALVAYESPEVYQAARQTPEGIAYSDLHWTLFDRERSRSGGAVALNGALAPETPYDALQKPLDWQSGHSTFFIGTRHPSLDEATFNAKLLEHVDAVRTAFQAHGLDGYVFVANGQNEVAFQHWPSPEAANAAFSSQEGKAIFAEAQLILVPVQFSVAEPFNGELKPGQAVNVRFERRKIALP